jgi:hypothetical protein
VADVVKARQLNIGTAGDFLGYIIAPLEAYPDPIWRSMFSGDFCATDPTTCSVDSFTPKPIGNDNYFFNVSHTFGERLTCSLLRGAGDTLAGDPTKYWSQYPRCAAFANDLALPPDADLTATPVPRDPTYVPLVDD